jgi:NET1-associated nuclear protein 1 (U3 small nucleolar RNA-associated protein 17)
MEFANIDNSVICATAGLDRVIKIWSLEASEEIENPKMIWMLIEQVSYKDIFVRCLSFSQDCSLLSAGFGNSLCVWDTTSFKLKCALSAPAIMDGSTNRVVISLPKKKKSNGSVSNFIEKRQKILQMMSAVINDPSQVLVKNLTQEKSRIFKRKPIEEVKSRELKCNEKKLIFERVLATGDLNLNEKLQILHKLNIYYNISSRVEEDLIDYISKNALDDKHLYKGLQQSVYDIKNDSKYKILWRFKTWRMLDVKRNRKIITVRKFLKQPIREEAVKLKSEEPEYNLLPVKNISSISNTIFCTNDLAHLIVVTTPTRVLIWNLLTLKIQGSFKIQCLNITHDPLTNLMAVFTKYNELFVIHPSPAMTLFHQKNLPNIYSSIWVPHEIPNMQSLSVNWQAVSQLLFLNHDQEICTLSSLNDENDMVDLTPYMNETNEVIPSTPFAAMLSKKEAMKKSSEINIRHILSNDSGSVREVS